MLIATIQKSQKVATTQGKILWRRKWQATPVFLPKKSYGERSLMGYSPWDGKNRTQLNDHVSHS